MHRIRDILEDLESSIWSLDQKEKGWTAVMAIVKIPSKIEVYLTDTVILKSVLIFAKGLHKFMKYL